jgi:3-deoxy-D-manno-octulosonic-acid transferase
LIARAAYAVLWWVAAPLIVLRLAWRARRQPGYLAHLAERFGSYAPVAAVPRIWIHAVSVGETRAAAPLVEALRRLYPAHRFVITHMTPTGRETGEQLFGQSVERAWLPYDFGFATRRFLAHYKPAFGVVMETEIWPRLLESAREANVPVLLANARLSQRSARRYAAVPGLTRWALANLSGIAAQTRADAERFAALGATNPEVLGNIKFDLDVAPEMIARGQAWRESLGSTRQVLVAGSTRDGEEALLLDALAGTPADAALLVVIVPRHPQRFEEVFALVESRGFTVARRSSELPVAPTVRVVIGDSMGEMLAYYAAADVVLMGGSLLDFGSQNLIEACAVGKPVIVGPSTYNFEEASKSAIAAGAAHRVRDAHEALRVAREWMEDGARRAAMGEAARAFAESSRGALSRLTAWITSRVGKT